MNSNQYSEEFNYFNMNIKEEIRDDDFLEEHYYCNECNSEDLIVTRQGKFCLDCGWDTRDPDLEL